MLFTLSAPDIYPRRAAYAVRFAAAAMQAKLPTVAATVTSRIGAIVRDWLRAKLSSSPSPNRDTRPNGRAGPEKVWRTVQPREAQLGINHCGMGRNAP